MDTYKEAQAEAKRDDRKQHHLDAATSAIRKDLPTATLVLGEKGLQVYSNIEGAALSSLVAIASSVLLNYIPKSDFDVKTT